MDAIVVNYVMYNGINKYRWGLRIKIDYKIRTCKIAKPRIITQKA